MCGDKISCELDIVPLSNDTVCNRICDMAGDILETLVNRVKNSKFDALQLDESTDIANLATVLVYVIYLG